MYSGYQIGVTYIYMKSLNIILIKDTRTNIADNGIIRTISSVHLICFSYLDNIHSGILNAQSLSVSKTSSLNIDFDGTLWFDF